MASDGGLEGDPVEEQETSLLPEPLTGRIFGAAAPTPEPDASLPAFAPFSTSTSDADAGLIVTPINTDHAATAAAAAAAAAPETSAAKLLTAMRSVDKSVSFSKETAETYMKENNFGGLIKYVSDILISVQGREQHQHPGIMCALYQAQIAHLVGTGKLELAVRVLKENVRPLLCIADDLYKPKNLKHLVEDADKSITNSVKLDDIISIVQDYFELYFPSTLTPNIERKGSLLDFVGVKVVDGGKVTRCLACRWALPEDPNVTFLNKHFTGGTHIKRCHYVTGWMKAYMNIITAEKEPMKQQNRKRRKPELAGGGSVLEVAKQKRKGRYGGELTGSIYIVSDELLFGISELCSLLCLVSPELKKEVSEDSITAAAKASHTVTELHLVSSEMSQMAMLSCEGSYTLDPAEVLAKVRAILMFACELSVPMLSLVHSKSLVQKVLSKAADVFKLAILAEVVAVEDVPVIPCKSILGLSDASAGTSARGTDTTGTHGTDTTGTHGTDTTGTNAMASSNSAPPSSG